MIYLRTAAGERFLLDTAKCKLVFEETEHDLTGATLDMYDGQWRVIPGEFRSGDGPPVPCQTFVIQDSFTGLGFEVPFTEPRAAEVSLAFAPNGDQRRFHRLRKALGR